MLEPCFFDPFLRELPPFLLDPLLHLLEPFLRELPPFLLDPLLHLLEPFLRELPPFLLDPLLHLLEPFLFDPFRLLPPCDEPLSSQSLP